MNTAVLSPVYADRTKAPSTFLRVAKNVMKALVESRARSAERELRRHLALRADLSRKQDHSADFLRQTTDLPFKI
ncbi:hypothetical protein [Microvirga guangxiensis]|uniref:Uncharacterized protein n=1 Tax=Microvirga guangxiensis TaxID=549386 RepID=A0A1G5I0D1_9HYPH|nr:hypothetical protein [Microvirga guangxiensis]SCY69483.1 hypothetical protein SAMN02927923_02004 [Microvirga guangxiensis]